MLGREEMDKIYLIDLGMIKKIFKPSGEICEVLIKIKD
jgi:hypothetical protein